jgi:nitrite reductase/ring-hydroxylating ferredoxin subunit
MDAEKPDTVPSLAEVWARDAIGPPPAVMLQGADAGDDLGTAPISKQRFISPEFHRLEVERLWKRVWQMACRERAIADVGDFVTYEIADQSVLIVREAPDCIKAYHNVCLHRGNRLVEGHGNVADAGGFQCTFHAWTWNTDGTLARVPCRWDFPNLVDEDYGLRPVRVGTWDGWVFINLQPDAEPLSKFLGDRLIKHFELWPMAERYVAAHVGKVIPANWKIAMEAFMETWHVFKVHPQALPGGIDSGAQYDHYGLHARMIEPIAIPSAHLQPGEYSEQDVIDSMIGAGTTAEFGTDVTTPQVPEGSTARAVLAELNRAQLGAASGRDFSKVSDAEMIDVIEYFVFPNFMPWGGFSFPIVYRFRPHGDDGQKCFFETLLMAPFEGERPPDAALNVLPDGARWSDAAELGGLGPILNQDDANLAKLQRGLHSDGIDAVSYSSYQESNIRTLHRGIDRYLAQD